MTRNRWTGVAGLLFGILFLCITILGPSTPDASGANGAKRYADYWNSSGHQSKAQLALFLASFACVLLVAFSAGLRDRLRAVDVGALPSYVLAAGVTTAALVGVGAGVGFSVGVTAANASSYKVDGSTAMLMDSAAYSILVAGMMAAASMAVVTGILTRRTGVLPAWTAWLGFLLGVTALGSFFTAWIGFFAFPVWVMVVSVVLLLRGETTAGAVVGDRVSVNA